MPAPSLDAIHAALATVNDPEINRPVTELGMVRSVDVDDGRRRDRRHLPHRGGLPHAIHDH